MLADELRKINKQFKESAPADIVETIEKNIADLAEGKLLKGSLKVGDRMPEFTLTNAVGEPVSSTELLSTGPLVINFYRGGW